MFKALAIVLSTLIVIYPLFATPDVSYEVSPNTITLGSPFRAFIHIKSKTAFNIQEQPLAEDFNPLHVISQKNINTPNSFNKTLAYTLQSFDNEETKIPTLNLYIIANKQQNKFIIPAYPLNITSAFSEKERKEPKLQKLKENIKLPFEWRWILWPSILALSCLLLGIVFSSLWRKRNQKNKPNTNPTPYISPYNEALQKLEKLKADKLFEQEQFKAHYTRLSDILKHFLSREFHCDLSEKTSQECQRLLHDNIGEFPLRKIKHILQNCDWVKFAKHRPSKNEHDEWLEKTQDIIEKLKQEEHTNDLG
eukprot:COSAG01_NODE_7_length_54400_cov_1218.054935_38_plen_308_part_00